MGTEQIVSNPLILLGIGIGGYLIYNKIDKKISDVSDKHDCLVTDLEKAFERVKEARRKELDDLKFAIYEEFERLEKLVPKEPEIIEPTEETEPEMTPEQAKEFLATKAKPHVLHIKNSIKRGETLEEIKERLVPRWSEKHIKSIYDALMVLKKQSEEVTPE